ncbi:glycerol-3-phosphate dehydrogenase, partial [Salmonella enterica subsp. enterica serovar Infantis]
ELKYLVDHEWVRRTEDDIWSRTKEVMWLTAEQQSRITQCLAAYVEKHQLSQAS